MVKLIGHAPSTESVTRRRRAAAVNLRSQSDWRPRVKRWVGAAGAVLGALLLNVPVSQTESSGSARARRGARWRELMLKLASWLLGVGVVAATFFDNRPPSAASVALTALSIGLWSVTVVLRDTWIALVLMLIVGLMGSGLNELNSSGPGYIVVFMAIASVAARFRLGISVPCCLLIAAVALTSEMIGARNPVSAGLELLIGMVFIFMAASFAHATGEANQRSLRLLAQEEELRTAQQEAAVLGERNRLARELHDVLAHSLSGLSIQLAGAALLAQKSAADPRLTEQIRLAQASAHEGMENAKRAVETLHEDALPGPADLPALLDRTRDMTGLAIDYRVLGAPRPMNPIAGLALYRTVQESVTNVVRHAGRGASARVLVEWDSDQAVVEIVDHGGDGRSAGLASGGHGLPGLRERADQLGGRFEAGPYDGGWRVRLTMPAPTADGTPR